MIAMSKTETLTAETITVSQIKALREEAKAASDSRLVDVCDVALASLESDNVDGTPLEDSDGNPQTRSEARALVAEMINEARAMDDSPDPESDE